MQCHRQIRPALHRNSQDRLLFMPTMCAIPGDSDGRTNSSSQPIASPRSIGLGGFLFIAGLALLAYAPSLSGGFIFDDDLLLTENNLIRQTDGVFRFWYTTAQPDYVPLTSSTLWLEWRLWGMNPTGYHVTNLLLHIAACLLIWSLLQRLSIPGAFLAAVLFAIHPVNVESVAWVEQRKNTLALVFFLLSIIWFLRTEEPSKSDGEMSQRENSAAGSVARFGIWYWLSLSAFALAMFSKGSVAILPLVLLLVAWWQRGKITRADLLRSAPFFAVAALLTPVIIWFVSHGSSGAVRNVSFPQRLAGAGGVIWFYLSKACADSTGICLSAVANSNGSTAVVAAAFGGNCGHRCAVLAAQFARGNLEAVGAVGLGILLRGIVAGRRLFGLGVFEVFIGGGPLSAHRHHRRRGPGVGRMDRLARPRHGASQSLAMVAVSLLVGVLTLLSWNQSRLYADAVTLYEATLARNPDAALVHHNLGKRLSDLGQMTAAIAHYRETARLMPGSAEARQNLGNALFTTGRQQEAIEEFRQAQRLEPENASAHYDLGIALAKTGRPQEALEEFRQAIRLLPDYAEAHNNLGSALLDTGQTSEAVEQFQQAIQLQPEYVQAYANLTIAYARLNRRADAIMAGEKAANLARSYGNTARAQQIETWLTNYRLQQTNPPSKSATPQPDAVHVAP